MTQRDALQTTPVKAELSSSGTPARTASGLNPDHTTGEVCPSCGAALTYGRPSHVTPADPLTGEPAVFDCTIRTIVPADEAAPEKT